MPTQVIRYACDICGDEYDTEEEAQRCETLGRAVGMKPGLIFSLLAKPEWVIAVATYMRDDAHCADWTGWLCKPGEPIVGPERGGRIIKEMLADPRQYAAEYDRMVAHLREQLPGERLMYFDGEFARDVDAKEVQVA